MNAKNVSGCPGWVQLRPHYTFTQAILKLAAGREVGYYLSVDLRRAHLQDKKKVRSKRRDRRWRWWLPVTSADGIGRSTVNLRLDWSTRDCGRIPFLWNGQAPTARREMIEYLISRTMGNQRRHTASLLAVQSLSLSLSFSFSLLLSPYICLSYVRLVFVVIQGYLWSQLL